MDAQTREEYWQDVLHLIDQSLVEIGEMMNAYPRFGTIFQQRMAVMMYRRRYVLAMIAGKDDEALQGLLAIAGKE